MGREVAEGKGKVIGWKNGHRVGNEELWQKEVADDKRENKETKECNVNARCEHNGVPRDLE